ncbi:MAG: cytochrome c biogenesis protein CcsA [Deltaproteobacteria bacterium]|nr:cytochrome c biogenesis protein CcsA [Deltaproteobacteria bacterium]
MTSAASNDSATASACLSRLERKVSRLRGPLGWTLALLSLIYAWTVISAPIDSVQGVIQKILYVHPPLAYGAYLGFVVTALSGVVYLWRGREDFDRLAVAGAEVGVIFCTLMLVTGPIWARGTWGKWWSWDPRLTVTLLLWFIYLAYMLLRSFSDGGPRTARFASVYGIVGIVLIPLNYYVIEIFDNRSMHPDNLERGSLGAGMGLPFLMGNLTFFVAFVYLLLLRWEVEALRTQAAREQAEERAFEGEGLA